MRQGAHDSWECAHLEHHRELSTAGATPKLLLEGSLEALGQDGGASHPCGVLVSAACGIDHIARPADESCPWSAHSDDYICMYADEGFCTRLLWPLRKWRPEAGSGWTYSLMLEL